MRWYHERQYGSRMIEAMLKKEGVKLCKTTICHILNKRQVGSKKPKAKLNPHRRRYELVIPGQRIQLDVKYVPEHVDGQRIYNYVAIDECTRWRFARAYPSLNEQSTYDFLEQLKAHIPFPITCIQTDNGFEFTSRLNPHMSPEQIEQHLMAQWCKQNQITHRCIKPGAKELNGKVERSHRIDEQYFYWKAPTDSIDHFNQALAFWLLFYNTQRLHGGLGFITPKQKLLERWQTLKIGPVADLGQALGHYSLDEIEKIRVRFVEQAPMRMASLSDWQRRLTLVARSEHIEPTRAPSLKKLKSAA